MSPWQKPVCQPEAGFVVSLVELQSWDVLNLVLVKNEDDAEGEGDGKVMLAMIVMLTTMKRLPTWSPF